VIVIIVTVIISMLVSKVTSQTLVILKYIDPGEHYALSYLKRLVMLGPGTLITDILSLACNFKN